MAVLITGLGYLGSALAARLLAEGEEVVGLENFFSTPREALQRLTDHRGLTLVEGSLTDPAALARAFTSAEIELVYHLAAQASAHPDAAPISYTVEVNFTGTRLLLEACVAHGVPRIVLASSTRLYRTPLPTLVHERSPVHADDLVHLSQLFGEVLLGAYLRAAGGRMSGVAARLGIVAGKGPVLKLDPRFLAAPQRFCLAAASGEPLTVATGPATVLPFVHIDDAVEGLVRCRDFQGQDLVVNVASEVRSVASVAAAVQVAALERGVLVNMRYLGRPRTYAPRRIESALAAAEFHPTRRVEDALGPVLDHYRSMVNR